MTDILTALLGLYLFVGVVLGTVVAPGMLAQAKRRGDPLCWPVGALIGGVFIWPWLLAAEGRE